MHYCQFCASNALSFCPGDLHSIQLLTGITQLASVSAYFQIVRYKSWCYTFQVVAATYSLLSYFQNAMLINKLSIYETNKTYKCI